MLLWQYLPSSSSIRPSRRGQIRGYIRWCCWLRAGPQFIWATGPWGWFWGCTSGQCGAIRATAGTLSRWGLGLTYAWRINHQSLRFMLFNNAWSHQRAFGVKSWECFTMELNWQVATNLARTTARQTWKFTRAAIFCVFVDFLKI